MSLNWKIKVKMTTNIPSTILKLIAIQIFFVKNIQIVLVIFHYFINKNSEEHKIEINHSSQNKLKKTQK
jgi:hypothetical protein